MKTYNKIIFSVAICLFSLAMPNLVLAGSQDVVFWNKMQNLNGSQLTSEIGGPDLNLNGSIWEFSPAKFDDGWDNQNESSYAYANSADFIENIREGAFSFWWVPDNPGNLKKGPRNVFLSNGATDSFPDNRYGLEFWYDQVQAYDPPTFVISLWKKDNTGNLHRIVMNRFNSPYLGKWQAGDKVHIAFAWHNKENAILGQYIAALWVDGALVNSWEEPDIGTLDGWLTTNPITPYSAEMRIGKSVFNYSVGEQLRGPIDNLIFWNYAKSDYSDRSMESPNFPPTADAGPNQSIHAGDTVTLDGNGSFDDRTSTENLLYNWTFSSSPTGSLATLNDADTVNPGFVSDLPGTYNVSLVVTDEGGMSSETSQVSISSLNSPPNADAGADRASYVGNPLILDGTESSDPDDDPLSYSWVLVTRPAGGMTELIDVDTATPSLTPDLPGEYEVELTVNDGLTDSSIDSVNLTIITAEDYTQQQLAEAINLVSEFPLSSVSTRGNKQALINFLKQAIKQLQKDNVENSISKIVMAIERTDGCALRGSADLAGNDLRKDYVTECDDQALLYPLLVSALEALQ